MVMVDRDDSHLNLSLSLPSTNLSLELNPSSPRIDPSSSTGEAHHLQGLIDVNLLSLRVGCDDKTGIHSRKSIVTDNLMSAISFGSCVRREKESNTGSEPHGEVIVVAQVISDEEDGDMSRKKLRLSQDQSAILDESFKENNTLNPKQKIALAKQLGLKPRQVEVWFQNRRARTKLKQTEVEFEFLKRRCQNLTEENSRLHKQLHELGPPKHSLKTHMNQPTTLTMCPSCQRVAVPSSFSSLVARPSGQVGVTYHRHGLQWVPSASIPHPGPFDSSFRFRPPS